jgi:DNA polymerase III epsilon subunit-like protein
MNYIVFDLEFNQGYNFENETENKSNPKCPFEIIQIGAVKLNENFETIGALDVLVKPEIYTKINPFVKEITGITMEDLYYGKSFKEMYEELAEFVKDDENVLSVWGVADITELFRNIAYHGLDASLVPTSYINIQSYASKELGCKKGINIGLANAAKLLNIPIENEFHNAFNDAFYTAKVFKLIYNEDIKTKVYDPYKPIKVRRLATPNYKIDFISLTKQFEKMFDREMTKEEKSIIKLSYIMGKTNQFQTKINDDLSAKK